jgi:predicted nucleic acid-binding protein
LAERLNATLLVDDAVARSVAVNRGLPVIGTLGVLLRAKRDGLVDQLLPLIDRMESLGMFISVDLRAQVLHLAGEADE